jgi:hypothetical protein
MPYDNEYNRMIARDIDYFNRKYVAHSDITGQGTIDYRSSYSDNAILGGGAGCAEYKMKGGAILGLQDGTMLGGPKVKTPSRAVISTFSSLGAPVQPASGLVVANAAAPTVVNAVRQALEEKQLYGRGMIGGSGNEAELRRMLDAEMKKGQAKLESKTKSYADRDANKEVDKAISNELRGSGKLKGKGKEGVRSKAELKAVLDNEVKKEEEKINKQTHDLNVREAEKEVAREVASAKRSKGGFFGAIARAAAPVLKRAATTVATNVAKNVGAKAMQHAQNMFMPPEAPEPKEPHQSHLDYESESTSSSTETSTTDESTSSTETSTEESTESEEEEEKSKKGKRGAKGSKGSSGNNCPPCKDAYNNMNKDRASNVGAKSQFERPTNLRKSAMDKGDTKGGSLLGKPRPQKSVAEHMAKPAIRNSRRGSGKGGSFIESVPASIGLQEGVKVKSEMKGSYMSGGGKGKRADIVKKVMKEKGISMIEASKYVKQHNLY